MCGSCCLCGGSGVLVLCLGRFLSVGSRGREFAGSRQGVSQGSMKQRAQSERSVSEEDRRRVEYSFANASRLPRDRCISTQ